MRVIVEIVRGSESGRWDVVGPGSVHTFGLAESADLRVVSDTSIAPLHFTVDCRTRDCVVRTLDGNVVWLNGVGTREARPVSGDQIQAGGTLFRVYIIRDEVEAEIAASSSLFASPHLLRAYLVLRTQPAPLYAILDAARDPRIPELIHSSAAASQSLYEKASDLDEVAPYLVHLPLREPLLAQVVAEGWGNSWGVFLAYPGTFGSVRSHLRRFLMVETEDGRQLYFRYYDPRVLRNFLPTCSGEQWKALLGSAAGYFLEDEDPATMLKFSLHPEGGSCNVLSLGYASRAAAEARR